MPHSHLDDAELVQLILTGEQAALMELYGRYGDAVYGLALRIVHQPHLAEEVTQNVFLKLWRQAAKWDANQGRLINWLLAVTRNAAIDRLRKERRRPPRTTLPWDSVLAAQGEVSPIDKPQWENGELLRSLLSQLPQEQYSVIELAYYAGMSHSEIAEHLALPLGTVKTRLRLAMEKLRRMWEEATTFPPDGQP